MPDRVTDSSITLEPDRAGVVRSTAGDWRQKRDERAETCSFQDLNLGGDSICVGGPGNGELGTVIRGGFWDFGIPNGGAFFLSSALTPESRWEHIGFRCAR